MGLWYSKDIDIALTAYADADYAGCQDSRRSTSGSALDQLEWVLWYAPWLSDQLEWVLWYAPWLSDQLEWICGMLHGLVINWSSSAIETSRNRVNVFFIYHSNDLIGFKGELNGAKIERSV
ncbi:hypothetical protein Tco_1177328 [Tanacetum coccineum]